MTESSDRNELKKRLEHAKRIADSALDPLTRSGSHIWCRSWKSSCGCRSRAREVGSTPRGLRLAGNPSRREGVGILNGKGPRMTTDKPCPPSPATLNAVVFSVGLVAVLTTPLLAQHLFFWIPAIVIGSFVVSPPLAWFIAPMIMQRFIQPRQLH